MEHSSPERNRTPAGGSARVQVRRSCVPLLCQQWIRTHRSQSSGTRLGNGPVHALLAGLLLVPLAGCPDTVNVKKFNECQTKLLETQEQVKKLEGDLVDRQQTIRNLQEQTRTLREIKAPMEQLTTPVKIELARMSGGYGEDQPYDMGLVLYVQPIDKDGDVIKAAGTIKATLFDLENPPDKTVIAECAFDASETHSLWYGKLWTNYYAVRCPWPEGKAPAHNKVTARVVFTDLLSGASLSTQQVFEIRLPATATSTAPAQ